MTVSLRGILAAVTTPFTADGSAIDEPVVKTRVDRLLAVGIHGLVPTGSAPTPATRDAGVEVV